MHGINCLKSTLRKVGALFLLDVISSRLKSECLNCLSIRFYEAQAKGKVKGKQGMVTKKYHLTS